MPYIPPSEILVDQEQDVKEKLRELIFKINKLDITGEISHTESDNFELTTWVDLRTFKETSLEIKIRLIHRDSERENLLTNSLNEVTFKNISLTNLSKYIVVEIWSKSNLFYSSLFKLTVEVPNGREDAIFNRIINNKVKFLQYLQFILQPERTLGSREIRDLESKSDRTGNFLRELFGGGSAIYESLMLTASRSPNKLKQIDSIIEKLKKADSEVVEDFLPIWEVYKTFIPNGRS
jgi:hypothetical protein